MRFGCILQAYEVLRVSKLEGTSTSKGKSTCEGEGKLKG
jgi:hypothetical protein